ncbi:MAG: 50S ribosomal protein L22 [Candidatus Terrybacteria bacterium]|nr:50S ribosomal protein L22 [Candidatus Terrybacteria bacterium]
MEVTAYLRHLKISPRKVRRVVDLVKNLSVPRAEAELEVRPELAAKPLRKLLAAAMSRVKDVSEATPDEVEIASFRVDVGPTAKRFKPRSRGMANPIARRTSHISLILRIPDRPRKKRSDRVVKEVSPPREAVVREDQGEDAELKPTAARSPEKITKPRMRPRVPRLGRRFFQRKSV